MPKLPLDQAQWGYYVQSFLIQKHKALEPNIVRVQILDQTPEGITFGFVVLTRGVVPFIIRNGDLQPMDILLSTDESGELSFQSLSDRNLYAFLGGIPIGDPAATNKLPDGTNPAINYAGTPGMFGGRGRNGMPGGALFSANTPVKLAALAIEAAKIEDIENLLKVASDAGVHEAVVDRYKDALKTAVYAHKQASETAPTRLAMEPKYDAGLAIEKIACYTDRGNSELTLKQAGDFLRSLSDDHERQLADLYTGKSVYWSSREGVNISSGQERAPEVRIVDPGLWLMNDQPAKVWKTAHLDGRPCNYLLAATQKGYSFATNLSGRAFEGDSSDDVLQTMFRRSSLRQGELAFMVNDKTQVASVPFRVLRSTVSGDVLDLEVDPILGLGHLRLTFTNTEAPYEAETGHWLFPNRGYQFFSLNDEHQEPCIHHDLGAKKTVQIVRGGGVYKVLESGGHAWGPHTEAQLMLALGERYDLSATALHALVAKAKTEGVARFTAETMPEVKVASSAHPEAIKLACDLLSLGATCAQNEAWFEDAQGRMIDALGKQAAAPMPGAGRPGETVPQPAPPTASGPNRPEEQNPAQSGVGAPGMMDPGAGIPMGMDPPGLQEISDYLIAAAMGMTPPEEMQAVYTDLVAKLTEAENMLGKILLLVQMQKADFITYSEVKRVLDEVDKFRATLMNAGMLSTTQMSPAVQATPIAQ